MVSTELFVDGVKNKSFYIYVIEEFGVFLKEDIFIFFGEFEYNFFGESKISEVYGGKINR